MFKVKQNTTQSQFRFSVSINFPEFFETPAIVVGGVPWKIQICKTKFKDENDGRDSINVSLICEYKKPENENSTWWIEAESTIKLIASNAPAQSIQKTIPRTVFESDCLRNELKNFIYWTDLIDEKNGFVKMNKFTFEAMITSSPIRFKESSGPCFEVTNTQFDMIIPVYAIKYNDLERYHSAKSSTIELRGIKWYVKSKMKETGLNIHLHNIANSKDFGCSFLVHFNVKLISFDDEIAPIEKSFKKFFTSDGSWHGWEPFIEREELLGAKHFVNKGKYMLNISIDVGPWQHLNHNKSVPLKTGMLSTMLTCAICLEESIDKEIKSTACGHLFCGDCIKKSIEQHGKCPLCNKNARIEELRSIFLQI